MLQTADSWHSNDSTVRTRVFRCDPTWWRFFIQPKMRPVFVIVTDIVCHQALQVTLTERNHMIEQISSAIAHESFCNTILPRTSKANPLWLNAKALDGCGHFIAKVLSSIEDQVAGDRTVRKRLAQLLGNPCTRRMRRRAKVQKSVAGYEQSRRSNAVHRRSASAR
jgi:ribosome maturation protein Sdo1